MMRALILIIVAATLFHTPCFADPKEDAFEVVKSFETAFDASDVAGVDKLFAPDAVFLGTVSPKVATTPQDIDAYFQGLKRLTPRKIVFDQVETRVLSETAVLFTGLDTFSQTKDGVVVEIPARFSMLVVKIETGWHILHFHSSVRPN